MKDTLKNLQRLLPTFTKEEIYSSVTRWKFESLEDMLKYLEDYEQTRLLIKRRLK